MTWLHRLDEITEPAQEEIGGKARSLARLAEAGLPVPPALVISADLFRRLREVGPPLPATLDGADALAAVERARAALRAASLSLPPALLAVLPAELDALAARATGSASYAVRSSAALEDRAGASAAGVFLSRLAVPAAEVPAAIRAVLASALSPAAVAYGFAHGLRPDELEMAVLIHPFTPGDAAGGAAFDPAAQPDPVVEPAGTPPASAAARATIVAAARALVARHGASEIEWVSTGDRVLFLQLRPYRFAAAPRWRWAGEIADRPWVWDVAHNPLPVSPAQAGLVALVDARCRTPFRQRVAGGYLFVAPTAPAPALATAATATAAAMDELRALAGDARLGAPSPSLEAALDLFVSIYEPLFARVQPAARAARDALAAFLRAHQPHAQPRLPELLAGVPSLATERARRASEIARTHAIADYLALFGDEAPAWDVAVPTYAEDPAPLARITLTEAAAPGSDAAAAAAEIRAALPQHLGAEWDRVLAEARAAAAVSEDDDAVYARAQAVVRRALLREGQRLAAARVLERREDVFWLPLEAVRADARGAAPLDRATALRTVADARRAHDEALADPPPLVPAAAGASTPALIRGQPGAPGRVLGRACLHARQPAAGEVLIARTLLPTELPLLSPAALVIEAGGALGHVAAQARERGIPAVVGAAGALAALRDGDRVLIDGDSGLVVKLPG
jgi:pyruvate,water dikinase